MTAELNSVMAKINSQHTMMDSEHHTHKRLIITQWHWMRLFTPRHTHTHTHTHTHIEGEKHKQGEQEHTHTLRDTQKNGERDRH